MVVDLLESHPHGQAWPGRGSCSSSSWTASALLHARCVVTDSSSAAGASMPPQSPAASTVSCDVEVDTSRHSGGLNRSWNCRLTTTSQSGSSDPTTMILASSSKNPVRALPSKAACSSSSTPRSLRRHGQRACMPHAQKSSPLDTQPLRMKGSATMRKVAGQWLRPRLRSDQNNCRVLFSCARIASSHRGAAAMTCACKHHSEMTAVSELERACRLTNVIQYSAQINTQNEKQCWLRKRCMGT